MHGLILGMLMALCLVFAAPDFRTRRINRQNEVNNPMKTDDTFDILPLPIAAPFIGISNSWPDDVKVKPGPHVGIIADELGERRVISRINWPSKLRSETIDFLRHKNLAELDEKVERADPFGDQTDVSGAKEEKEKVKVREKAKGEEEEEEEEEKGKEKDESTTLEPSVDPKVLNNKTKPKDQEQMIRIELPAGVRTGQNTKLLHTNDIGFVNPVEENLTASKAPENNENRVKPRPGLYRDDLAEKAAHFDNFSPPHIRKRRNAEESSSRDRIEFEKITLQFEHLSDSRKTKFCAYLKKGSIKDPLPMLMALLGKVYSKSSKGSFGHWDRARDVKLGKTENKKRRQKLILKWACEDWGQAQDRIYGDAPRTMGISRTLVKDGELESRRNFDIPFGKPENAILEFGSSSPSRRVSEENRRTGISANEKQLDGFVLSLKLSGDNRVTKQVRVIIDMDEDTRDYHN